MADIAWLRDVEMALSLAKSNRKPVLLDFFNPE
jgi:hypothetical protein